MKKGSIKRLWMEMIRNAIIISFFYYFGGIMYLLGWMYLYKVDGLLSIRGFRIVIEESLILACSATAYMFLVLLLEGLCENFHMAFTVALVVQMVSIMVSQRVTVCSIWCPLSHSNILKQLNGYGFTALLLHCIVEMMLLALGAYSAVKRNYEKLMGCI